MALGGISVELIRVVYLRSLRAHSVWLVVGLLGPTLIALWLLSLNFAIREQFDHFVLLSKLLLLWHLVFTLAFIVFYWLRPREDITPPELRQAPLPPVQHLIHRLLHLAAAPLTVMLLALPVYLLMLIYFGDPYNSGSQTLDWRWGPNWEWRELMNPWGARVFFSGLNIMAATLLPIGLAGLLRELISKAFVRIVLLLAIPALVWFITQRIEHEFFRICYQQTRGYSPWSFLVVGLLLMLLPLLLGWLRPRYALLLLSLAAVLTAALAILPFIIDTNAGGGGFFRALRNILGDTRFACAYYFGHLQLWLNVELIMNSYTSCVLLDDHTAGNLIPRRVALWVGAGLYPLLAALWLIKGYALGYLLRPKKWRE